MKKILTVVCFALSMMPVLAVAQDVRPNPDEKQVALPDAELVGAAMFLIAESLGHLAQNDSDQAVGFATAALDIARESKDPVLPTNIERLLHVYRAVNLMMTVDMMKRNGSVTVAVKIKALSCRMVNEASSEFAPALEVVKKFCGDAI